MSVEPPPPPPMPDIMEATSLRFVRKRVTYSRAGSWSLCTHEMQSTGQESIEACRCVEGPLDEAARTGFGSSLLTSDGAMLAARRWLLLRELKTRCFSKEASHALDR